MRKAIAIFIISERNSNSHKKSQTPSIGIWDFLIGILKKLYSTILELVT